MMVAIVMVSIMVIAVVMVPIVMVDVMMVEIAMVIFHHMFEIPARLLIIMFEGLVIFADKAAVAGTQTGIAFAGPAIKIAAAMPDDRTIAAVPLAGIMDEAIVFAMPAFEMAIMIAPPVAIAAIVGAAPPADIVRAFARGDACRSNRAGNTSRASGSRRGSAGLRRSRHIRRDARSPRRSP